MAKKIKIKTKFEVKKRERERPNVGIPEAWRQNDL